MLYRRLLHDFKRKEILYKIVGQIGSFLTDRITILKTAEYTSGITTIYIGIPYGLPLSPILYLFYNAGLFERIARLTDVNSTGFINNVALIVVDSSTRENYRNLIKAYERKYILQTKTYRSEFVPAKYQLAYLTNKVKNVDINANITLPGYDDLIKLKPKAKYLELIFDSKLIQKPYIKSIKNRVIKSVGALAKILGSVQGESYVAVRKIYKATVLLQIIYCCSVQYLGFIRKSQSQPVKILTNV